MGGRKRSDSFPGGMCFPLEGEKRGKGQNSEKGKRGPVSVSEGTGAKTWEKKRCTNFNQKGK